MKTLSILILTMLTFYFSDITEKKITSKYNCTKIIENEGRCSGSSYCSACSNCSRCAHCSNGGTCGVCSGSSSNSFYTTTPKAKKKVKITTSTYYYEPVQETTVYYENESITIYSETINLREEPNTKSIILEKLSYGDTVVFIEKTGEWSKIKVEETGTIGFVFSKLLNF
jgi:hypothetical protein